MISAEVRERRRVKVGQAIIAGANRQEALMSAGYSRGTARKDGKETIDRLGVMSYIEDWKATHAQDMIKSLTKTTGSSGDMLQDCKVLINTLEDGPAKAKLMMEFTKIASQRAQDLLDRAGISRVTKSAHMRVDAKSDWSDLTTVRARIQALQDRIDGKDSQKVEIRGVAREELANGAQSAVVTDLSIQPIDAVYESQRTTDSQSGVLSGDNVGTEPTPSGSQGIPQGAIDDTGASSEFVGGGGRKDALSSSHIFPSVSAFDEEGALDCWEC